MIEVQWRVRQFLEQRGQKPYGLAKAMGLEGRSQVVYRLVNTPPARVDLKTLSKVLEGLERLTGEEVGLSDILEIHKRPDVLTPLLEQNAPPRFEKRLNLSTLPSFRPRPVGSDYDPVRTIRQARGHQE